MSLAALPLGALDPQGPAAEAARVMQKDAKTRASARAAAEEFEAVFAAQMMQPMFESISTDGPFGGGQGEKMFRSMMIQEIGKGIAKSGGIGIADAIYGEMLRMQGMTP